MGRMRRVRLEERLRQAGAGNGFPPAIFEVFFDSYFCVLSEMCDEPYYETLYDACLSGFNPERGFCLLPEAVAGAAVGDTEEGRELLFRVLLEPFGDPMWEEEIKEKKVGGKKDGDIQ